MHFIENDGMINSIVSRCSVSHLLDVRIYSDSLSGCCPLKRNLDFAALPIYQRGCKVMPNIQSAKKRVRVSNRKTLRNKMVKSNLKTALKKADVAIAENASNKQEAVRFAIKKVDQATAKGIFHKNKAARMKSQLMNKFNASL